MNLIGFGIVLFNYLPFPFLPFMGGGRGGGGASPCLFGSSGKGGALLRWSSGGSGGMFSCGAAGASAFAALSCCRIHSCARAAQSVPSGGNKVWH